MAFLGSFFFSNRGLNSVITLPGDIACIHTYIYILLTYVRLTVILIFDIIPLSSTRSPSVKAVTANFVAV